jgi:lipocalin
MKAGLIALLAATGSSCMQNKPLPTVNKLEVSQYAGLWYEAARFPHRFERNLQCVTARYTLRPDGKITVQNRGRKSDGSWSDIQGKAFVPDTKDPGKLKVQFFWPFRAPYWVLKLDSAYQYALVGTPGRDYLWVLSRTLQIPETVLTEYLNTARELGFDISRVERVKQDCH